MFEKLNFSPPIYDRRFDFTKDELTTLESIGRVAQSVNTIIDFLNTWDVDLSKRELSEDITNKRKLSPDGNFTGSLMGKLVSLVLADIGDNRDKIVYLVNQFSDGQTGYVIDGGFFEDDSIDKNYNGGVF